LTDDGHNGGGGRVETVVEYYIKWMERFPDVTALSKATEEEVNSLWAGRYYPYNTTTHLTNPN